MNNQESRRGDDAHIRTTSDRGVSARCAAFAALALVGCAASAPAQIGWRDETLINTGTTGSMVMPTRFFYPATRAGWNAPVRPQAGGHPVVVFMHGYGRSGGGYRPLGEKLATAGFIAVHCDTAIHDWNLQRDDGIAMFDTLVSENGRQGSFLYGALDMAQAALSGHSMGGGNTIRVLADNPGYAVGICFAPEGGSSHLAPRVSVPLLIIHGEGDRVLPWRTTAQAYYDNATSYSDLKAFVLLDQDCNHNNLAHISSNATAAHRAVFQRSMNASVGWLAEHLRGHVSGLELALGPPVVGDPRVTSVQAGVRTPRLWAQGAAVIGGSFGLRLAAERGFAVLLAAEAPGYVPTPLGPMLLDPVTAQWLLTVATCSGATVVDVQVPNDPNLVGIEAWFQAITLTDGMGFRMSNPVTRTGTR